MPFFIEVEKADGSYIFDKNGNKYLDAISGIGVSNFGHNQSSILEAIERQSSKHLHVMVYGEFGQESQTTFSKNLTQLCPKELDTVYFVNSGAEAIDAALKLVKKHTGRQQVISFVGAYHGNTHGPMSLSYNAKKKDPFRPLVPGVSFIRLNNHEDLEKITHQTAGVFLETIQGDAGVRIPTVSFMKALRERCTATGSLLVLDEIQCGLGRTGKTHAFEHFGIVPDILVLGKALGGGLPIGGLVAPRSILQSFETAPMLGHITTFGGHPLPCATGNAALELLKQTDLSEVDKKGRYLAEHIQAANPAWSVRQIGLFLAVDCSSVDEANSVILKAKEAGLILFWFLSHPDSFRIAPPLNISWEELEEIITILKKVV